MNITDEAWWAGPLARVSLNSFCGSFLWSELVANPAGSQKFDPGRYCSDPPRERRAVWTLGPSAHCGSALAACILP